ncbi:MAG TPA: hypothetical protein VKV40_21285 [Ktedonobacteraceae bacterium]|nr:hypothetical protein [Ktedonobacteraceae bacterium]
MAGWEEELAVLLRNLGVTQEEPSAHRRKRCRRDERGLHHSNLAQDSFFEEGLHSNAAFFEEKEKYGEFEEFGEDEDEEEAWLTDLNEMRREVDSIVNQVIHLMQRGDLDKSLKEDVLVVLRALRRPQAMQQETANADEEAYLESAASMLHFCRLVLRLSEVASEDR